MTKDTITLTDRAPVTIREAAWPIIASAQSFRRYSIRVRQHDDGRAIVYAIYDTNYKYESGTREGELLNAGDDIPAAIRRVGERCGCQQCIDACIADLPVVDLDAPEEDANGYRAGDIA